MISTLIATAIEGLTTGVVFLIILSVLVLIHELGHFFVAKKLGIKVEEFGFGFPPKVFGIKRGETLYSVNLLPIGGFVKLYGEDEAGAGKVQVKTQSTTFKDQDRAFFARPTWQKITVVAAGVFMNFVLAVGILSFLFSYQGVPTLGDKVSVSQVLPNSPAEKVGMKNGEVIESINGVRITDSQQLINITKKHLGQEISIKVKTPSSQTKVFRVVPRKNYPADQGPMGIALSQNVIVQKYPWYKAPIVGTKEALKTSGLIVVGLADVVKQLVLHARVPAGVAGPLGIAQLTGQLVQTGPTAVLSFVALLSLNLAILNILPIPALDGGRLFFILIEGITRRKVNPRFESYAHGIGIAVLLGLIAVITLHDLLQWIHGQPILPKQ